MYTDKRDLEDGLPRYDGMKGIKWLKFNGDDKGMQIDEEKNDESLVIQVLMQNLEKVESELIAINDRSKQHLVGAIEKYVKNEGDLTDLLHGKYEAALIRKYESAIDFTRVVGG